MCSIDRQNAVSEPDGPGDLHDADGRAEDDDDFRPIGLVDLDGDIRGCPHVGRPAYQPLCTFRLSIHVLIRRRNGTA